MVAIDAKPRTHGKSNGPLAVHLALIILCAWAQPALGDWDLREATIAHWPCADDGDGAEVMDVTGSHPGLFHDPSGDPATASHAADGVAGGGLRFDGADDVLVVKDHAALDLGRAFSVSFWFRADEIAKSALLVSKSDFLQDKRSWHLAWRGDLAQWRLLVGSGADVTTYYRFNNRLESKQFYHFTAVYDDAAGPAKRWKLYIDGQRLELTEAVKDEGGGPRANDAPLTVGAGRSDGFFKNFFRGTIQDIRIMGRAIQAAEVAGLYNGGKGTRAHTGAVHFFGSAIQAPFAIEYAPYKASISRKATTPDPKKKPKFAKVSGPAWLRIAADGALSGTPDGKDMGRNLFRVRASGPDGRNAETVLEIEVRNWNLAPATVARWTLDANGSSAQVLDDLRTHHGLFVDPSGNAAVVAHRGKGVIRGALGFDGVDDRVAVPHHKNLALEKAFSISLWLKNESVASKTAILSKGDAGGGKFSWGLSWDGAAGHWRAATGTGDVLMTDYRFAGVSKPGAWMHVAAVYLQAAGAGGRWRLFADGKPLKLVETPADRGGPLRSFPLPLLLGARRDGDSYGDFFKGWMDDLRIFNRVLTETEIAGLYNGGRGAAGSTSSPFR